MVGVVGCHSAEGGDVDRAVARNNEPVGVPIVNSNLSLITDELYAFVCYSVNHMGEITKLVVN